MDRALAAQHGEQEIGEDVGGTRPGAGLGWPAVIPVTGAADAASPGVGTTSGGAWVVVRQAGAMEVLAQGPVADGAVVFGGVAGPA